MTATRSVSPSVLSAANRHQYSDRTLIRTDQQPEFQPVLHHYAGRIIYFIRIQSMDAFIDTLIQLLIDWGYAGLFISALLAGSIIPFSSELVMLALVKVGLNPAICVLAATLGNTMGGMTCYYMGHLGKTDWIEKYFKVKQEKIDKMQRFLQGKGALMAFFAFLPFIGEAIAIALGFMRSNVMLTSLSMFTGKLIRYIVMLSALQGALSVMSV